MAYQYTVYRSIEEVDLPQWRSLLYQRDDIFMEPGFLRAVESSMSDDAQVLPVLFHDERGEAVGSACVHLCHVSLATLTEGRGRKWASVVARAVPPLNRIPLLGCGLPIPAGQSHLRLAPRADTRQILRLLDQLLGELARRHRCRVILMREFTAEECQRLEPLEELGYFRGEALPMNHAPPGFASFDEFCASLGSRKRYTIRRSREKFAGSGLGVVHLKGCEGAGRLYTEQVHRLFRTVADAKPRLDVIPAAFFRQLAEQLPKETVYTFIKEGDRIVACAMSLCGKDAFHQLFVGFDKDVNPSCDLYFNLFFEAVDYAYRQGAPEIFLGASSETFKSQKLGACQSPRYYYVKCPRPLMSMVVRRIVRKLQPVRS